MEARPSPRRKEEVRVTEVSRQHREWSGWRMFQCFGFSLLCVGGGELFEENNRDQRKKKLTGYQLQYCSVIYFTAFRIHGHPVLYFGSEITSLSVAAGFLKRL